MRAPTSAPRAAGCVDRRRSREEAFEPGRAPSNVAAVDQARAECRHSPPRRPSHGVSRRILEVLSSRRWWSPPESDTRPGPDPASRHSTRPCTSERRRSCCTAASARRPRLLHGTLPTQGVPNKERAARRQPSGSSRSPRLPRQVSRSARGRPLRSTRPDRRHTPPPRRGPLRPTSSGRSTRPRRLCPSSP